MIKKSPIRAVLFDMDGTITKPILDFDKIREDIGIKDGASILEYMDGLEKEVRDQAIRILEKHESEAAEKAEANKGIQPLFQFLAKEEIPTAVVTRNSRKSLKRTLQKLCLKVSFAVCRGEAPPKPSPEPAILAAKSIGVDPENCLFVGDYEDDIRTGIAAGIRTILIPSRPPKKTMPKPDFHLTSALEIIPIICQLNGLKRVSTSE